jgi:hypothetical protein
LIDLTCARAKGIRMLPGSPKREQREMAMLLEHSGHAAAGTRIDTAVAHVTGTKMKSQAAGKMGYGTKEVGDLVVAVLVYGSRPVPAGALPLRQLTNRTRSRQ